MPRITLTVTAVILAVVLAGCAGERDEPTAEPDPEDIEVDEPDVDEPDMDDPIDEPDADDPIDDGPDVDPPERVEPDQPDRESRAGDAGDGAVTDALDAEVAAAIADAADRAGSAPDAVSVVTAEFVTWPDGSIGCPAPDQMYTMALVDGYRIVLEVEGRELAYHGQEGSPPFYCAQPADPAQGGGRPTS